MTAKLSNFVFCLGIVDLCHYRFSEMDHKICYFLGRLTTNSFQLQGGFAPLTPHQGLCPRTSLGALPPDPHYRLALPRSPSSPSRNEILRTPLFGGLRLLTRSSVPGPRWGLCPRLPYGYRLKLPRSLLTYRFPRRWQC